MTAEIWYHGSPNLQRILDEGFDIDAPRIRDTGDFGWGIYLTTQVGRARYHGESTAILAVEIDIDNFAYIQNPYFLYGPTTFRGPKQRGPFLPVTYEEHLFFDTVYDLTDNGHYVNRLIKGKQRKERAKLVRQVFMYAGYDGIITDIQEGEAVIFNTDAIINIWTVEVPPSSEDDDEDEDY